MFDEETTALITQAKERTAGMRTKARMPEGKRVALMATNGPLKGQSFPITLSQVLLGRLSPEGRSPADVVIDDPKVSRKHCVLEIHGLAAYLVDLDSVNGTFVDGKKIAVCELKHFSEFRIGGTTLMLTFSSL